MTPEPAWIVVIFGAFYKADVEVRRATVISGIAIAGREADLAIVGI